MFEKFQIAVRNAYLKLKDTDQLHFDREWPSPGDLKSWCLTRYFQGISKEDEVVYLRFFNDGNHTNDLVTCIQHYELDKLRPLRNFIIGDTQRRPDEDIVKLLAVLIDFSPRPYMTTDWIEKEKHGKSVVSETSDPKESNSETGEVQEVLVGGEIIDNENIDILPGRLTEGVISGDIEKMGEVEKEFSERKQINGIGQEEEENIDKQESEEENHAPPANSTTFLRVNNPIIPRQNRSSLYGLGGIILIIGIFSIISFSQTKQCMCWLGERYEKVSCKDKTVTSKIIALNEEKFYNFKKIMRPDTLTVHDVNKVWYSKINNRVEFFTGSGMHPIHDHRSLKAATKYIIEQYAGKNSDIMETSTD